MKKIVSVLFAAIFVVSLAGCSAKDKEETADGKSSGSDVSFTSDSQVTSSPQEPSTANSEAPVSGAVSSTLKVTNSTPPAAPSKQESKPAAASEPVTKPESKSEPIPPSVSTEAPPEGTGATDLYFTLNGETLTTEMMEKKWKGGGSHDSDGDGIKEEIGFSLLIELMGKKPEQLADIGTIEFMDGTAATKSVGDLVQSVVVFKSNDGSINDKWGDFNIRFRFICNDMPLAYVKSVTWAVK